MCATITSSILEHFHHLREDPQLLSYPSRSLHLLQPWPAASLFSVLIDFRAFWTFWTFHEAESCRVWPLVTGSLHLASVLVAQPRGSRNHRSLPRYGWASIVQICHVLFIHSSTDGHSTCFCLPSQFLTKVQKWLKEGKISFSINGAGAVEIIQAKQT